MNEREAWASGVWERTLTVEKSQTDARGRITPCALTRLVCDSAAIHWESVGIGFAALAKENLRLVLVRTAMEVSRLPQAGETVVLRSWMGAEKWWLYPRRCVICAEDGTRLVSACSQWSLIDAVERKLLPPHPIMDKLPPVTLPEEPRAPKMKLPFPELTQWTEHPVHPEEIDRNGHVNNAWYVDWAAALAGDERPLRSLWIEYDHELFEGQTVRMDYRQEGDALYVKGIADGRESFAAKLVYGA